MNDERIDFSPLDPKRDPMRFEGMVQVVLASIQAPRASPFLRELVYWGRTAVAVGAIFALAAWLPSLVQQGSTGTAGSTVAASDAVELVAGWAESGKVPSDVDLIQTLQESDDR